MDKLVPLSVLQEEHEEYTANKLTWACLQDLRIGAPALLPKIEQYLPKRPDETKEEYEIRKKKFCYTPVLSKAVREFSAKLASSPVTLTGVEDLTWWKGFLEDTNGKGRDQDELLNLIFSTMVFYGTVYLAVDAPCTHGARSLAEMNHDKPKIVVYEPLDIIDWGEDWYKMRQFTWVKPPLGKQELKVSWTLFTTSGVYKYSAYVKSCDCRVTELKQGSGYVKVNENTRIPLDRSWEHGYGLNTMTHVTLPAELWVAKECYLKQKQHILIESQWTDTGSIAGSIQRVYTPDRPPEEDPRFDYTLPEPPDFGTAKIILGQFAYVESEGKAISNLQQMLDKIESQIRDLVSMGYLDRSGKYQSGRAKEVDLAVVKDTMAQYGQKVAQAYQRVLRLVSVVVDKPEKLVVLGLDNYSVDNLETTLRLTRDVATLPNIPLTAQKLWYGKLVDLMIGTVDPEQEADIQEELDGSFAAALDPNNPDDIRSISDAFNITEEDAKFLLDRQQADTEGEEDGQETGVSSSEFQSEEGTGSITATGRDGEVRGETRVTEEDDTPSIPVQEV